ncbi:CPL18 [Auxenochlorella protothecoides x Auxenochlorella symbiontica]|uniref:DUF676 domain-containing protein n=1 Tax=Auxenochlorella protothecoides TaxID=3075 RepID=A0A1D2A180_AUXPR
MAPTVTTAAAEYEQLQDGVLLAAEERAPAPADPRHLFCMVHGLFGSRANWKVIAEELRDAMREEEGILFYISEVNEFKKTYEGIDGCGERLVEEIHGLMAQYPLLEEISILGHSMGGLIARYAMGRLYDAETGRIAGRLLPVHFIGMACPHLGCDTAPGPAQVPMLKWMEAWPVVGPAVAGAVSSVAASFTRASFKRSGEQFFLGDREAGAPPLIWRLARDEGPGAAFLPALAAFQTRTAYANTDGDHLVGWANASLRRLEELPELDGVSGKEEYPGVLRADPLETAWGPRYGRGQTLPSGTEGALGDDDYDLPGTGSGRGDEDPPMLKSAPTSFTGAPPASPSPLCGAIELHPSPQTASLPGPLRHQVRYRSAALGSAYDAALHADRTELVEDTLRALRTLSWRRVDAGFAHSALPLLAHQHIQVQRLWVNGAGVPVARHLAHSLRGMEEARREGRRGARGRGGAAAGRCLGAR